MERNNGGDFHWAGSSPVDMEVENSLDLIFQSHWSGLGQRKPLKQGRCNSVTVERAS